MGLIGQPGEQGIQGLQGDAGLDLTEEWIQHNQNGARILTPGIDETGNPAKILLGANDYASYDDWNEIGNYSDGGYISSIVDGTNIVNNAIFGHTTMIGGDGKYQASQFARFAVDNTGTLLIQGAQSIASGAENGLITESIDAFIKLQNSAAGTPSYTIEDSHWFKGGHVILEDIDLQLSYNEQGPGGFIKILDQDGNIHNSLWLDMDNTLHIGPNSSQIDQITFSTNINGKYVSIDENRLLINSGAITESSDLKSNFQIDKDFAIETNERWVIFGNNFHSITTGDEPIEKTWSEDDSFALAIDKLSKEFNIIAFDGDAGEIDNYRVAFKMDKNGSLEIDSSFLNPPLKTGSYLNHSALEPRYVSQGGFNSTIAGFTEDVWIKSFTGYNAELKWVDATYKAVYEPDEQTGIDGNGMISFITGDGKMHFAGVHENN